ncbi:hypothetical protein GCM10012275_61410 [Longimycelium tulufanense]|uniref:Uncharacterized protein n=1 Tax=Longimycelium tulufanense TaxID=907463 RepID=A0A8J3CL02_9PSEU|nr:hypothetical protein [Longimycelium tulufanense]GGM82542.1 hypothetical protein GCM10012275_61410 [Longimycelium tulufanense]
MRYRRLPDGRIAEIAPTHCRHDPPHPLGPGTVLVGWDPGLRARTWTCRACLDAGRADIAVLTDHDLHPGPGRDPG